MADGSQRDRKSPPELRTETSPGSTDAVLAAVESAARADRKLADVRVDLAKQLDDIKLAQLRAEIGLVLMSVVMVKVVLGEPSAEERKVKLIADLLLDTSQNVTKASLLQALADFDAAEKSSGRLT